MDNKVKMAGVGQWDGIKLKRYCGVKETIYNEKNIKWENIFKHLCNDG